MRVCPGVAGGGLFSCVWAAISVREGASAGEAGGRALRVAGAPRAFRAQGLGALGGRRARGSWERGLFQGRRAGPTGPAGALEAGGARGRLVGWASGSPWVPGYARASVPDCAAALCWGV